MKNLENNFLPEKAQAILKFAAAKAKEQIDWKDGEKILNKAIAAVQVLYPRRFK